MLQVLGPSVLDFWALGADSCLVDTEVASTTGAEYPVLRQSMPLTEYLAASANMASSCTFQESEHAFGSVPSCSATQSKLH